MQPNTDIMQAVSVLLTKGNAPIIWQATMIEPSAKGGGVLVLYTYEPSQMAISLIETVITATRPLIEDGDNWWHNGCWSLELFSRGGLFECYSDGRSLNRDGIPVEHSNAFQVPGHIPLDTG